MTVKVKSIIIDAVGIIICAVIFAFLMNHFLRAANYQTKLFVETNKAFHLKAAKIFHAEAFLMIGLFVAFGASIILISELIFLDKARRKSLLLQAIIFIVLAFITYVIYFLLLSTEFIQEYGLHYILFTILIIAIILGCFLYVIRKHKDKDSSEPSV